MTTSHPFQILRLNKAVTVLILVLALFTFNCGKEKPIATNTPSAEPPATAPQPVTKRRNTSKKRASLDPHPSSADIAQIIKARTKNIEEGQFAYEAPSSTRVGKKETVTLRIGSMRVDHTLMTGGMPNAQTGRLPVYTLMSAHLTGQDFTIVPRPPEAQFVDDTGTPTEWVWDIEANKSGTLKLYITAFIVIEGVPKKFKTLDRDITVQSDPWFQSRQFISTNWQYILTTLSGSGFLAFIGAWVIKRRQKPDEPKP